MIQDSVKPVATTLWLLLLLIGSRESVWADDAKSLFREYSNRIYQIRIIDRSSGKQASIGSGFLITAEGLLITNYHVISDYAHQPKRFNVEFVTHDGQQGALSLINIDVVNDLALLKLDVTPGYFIELADSLPAHGESIYSIGNPHDIGWTVIPGTYNGIAAYSFYERIHFSGSVNPGMSGGPVLNDSGRVIGVNVATAGNQLSFLVPLNRVAAFVQTSSETEFDVATGRDAIAQQLRTNQREVIGKLVDANWETAPFGDATVPSEIASQVRCWGYSDDDPDISYSHAATTCNSEEQIHLSNGFTTGNVAYQFNWLESETLNAMQFYNMYSEKIAKAYADNEAGKEDVTEFVCHDGFIESASLSSTKIVTKSTFCVREYKKYPQLFDVLFFGASVHLETKALISHFTIAGVEKGLAIAFLRKFVESVRWN
jgi:serine protease Do